VWPQRPMPKSSNPPSPKAYILRVTNVTLNSGCSFADFADKHSQGYQFKHASRIYCSIQLATTTMSPISEASAYLLLKYSCISCRSLSSTGSYADVTSNNVRILFKEYFSICRPRGKQAFRNCSVQNPGNYKVGVLLLQLV
jgi:hypothetical protein